MNLTIQAYNRAEELADISTPVWMAFAPHTFQETRFPTHVTHPRQLLRYADTNNEGKTPEFYKPGAVFRRAGYANGFTHDEIDLMRTLREKIAEATREHCGRAVMPMTNLLAQTGPFRAFNSVGRKLRIFEIGPGCGYLGAMLMLQGVHTYWSTDITQGLYLWQSLTMEAMGNFHEGAGSTQPHLQKQFAHIPYWDFTNYLFGNCPSFDIVYSNNNLAEMTPLALSVVCTIAKKMIGDKGVFLYFASGHKQFTGWDDQILNIGLKRVPLDICSAFSQSGAPFPMTLAPYNPSGRGGNIDANVAVATPTNMAPIDIYWGRAITGWDPPVI